MQSLRSAVARSSTGSSSVLSRQALSQPQRRWQSAESKGGGQGSSYAIGKPIAYATALLFGGYVVQQMISPKSAGTEKPTPGSTTQNYPRPIKDDHDQHPGGGVQLPGSTREEHPNPAGASTGRSGGNAESQQKHGEMIGKTRSGNNAVGDRTGGGPRG